MKKRLQKTAASRPQRSRKTWREKLTDSKGLPKVITISSKNSKWGTGTCAIPAPRDIDALMRRVPRGKLTTIDELRKAVASQHHADMGCPLTTGIFSKIAAHAAAEAIEAGETAITPYWRTLKGKGEINPKYPGGVAGVAARLRAEGHTIVKKGQRSFVLGYENALAEL